MDLDNDGIKDLFFGHPSGGLMHFKGKGNLVFDPVVGDGDVQVNGDDFTMYYYAFPEIVDWNEDGLWDLLAHGKHNWDDAPNLLLFINEGTKEQYQFTKELQYQDEGGIGFPYMEPRIVPTVADLDNDGKKDIILGAANGELHFYSNYGTNTAPLFDFASKEIVTNDGGKYWTTVLPELKPDIADLNGDGKLDIITGGCGNGKGAGGGSELDIYISYGYGDVSNKKVSKNLHSANIEKQFSVNNVNGKYYLNNNSLHSANFTLFNMKGAAIVSIVNMKAAESIELNSLNLQSFYLLRIVSQGQTINKKFVTFK